MQALSLFVMGILPIILIAGAIAVIFAVMKIARFQREQVEINREIAKSLSEITRFVQDMENQKAHDRSR